MKKLILSAVLLISLIGIGVVLLGISQPSKISGYQHRRTGNLSLPNALQGLILNAFKNLSIVSRESTFGAPDNLFLMEQLGKRLVN